MKKNGKWIAMSIVAIATSAVACVTKDTSIMLMLALIVVLGFAFDDKE